MRRRCSEVQRVPEPEVPGLLYCRATPFIIGTLFRGPGGAFCKKSVPKTRGVPVQGDPFHNWHAFPRIERCFL